MCRYVIPKLERMPFQNFPRHVNRNEIRFPDPIKGKIGFYRFTGNRRYSLFFHSLMIRPERKPCRIIIVTDSEGLGLFIFTDDDLLALFIIEKKHKCDAHPDECLPIIMNLFRCKEIPVFTISI